MNKNKKQSKRGVKKGAEYNTIAYHQLFLEMNKGIDKVKKNELERIRHNRLVLASMYPNGICDKFGRFQYDISDTPLIHDLFSRGWDVYYNMNK